METSTSKSKPKPMSKVACPSIKSGLIRQAPARPVILPPKKSATKSVSFNDRGKTEPQNFMGELKQNAQSVGPRATAAHYDPVRRQAESKSGATGPKPPTHASQKLNRNSDLQKQLLEKHNEITILKATVYELKKKVQNKETGTQEIASDKKSGLTAGNELRHQNKIKGNQIGTTAKQNSSEGNKIQMEKEIEKARLKYREERNRRKQLEAEVSELNKRLRESNAGKCTLKMKKTQMAAELKLLQEKLGKLEATIKNLTEDNTKLQKILEPIRLQIRYLCNQREDVINQLEFIEKVLAGHVRFDLKKIRASNQRLRDSLDDDRKAMRISNNPVVRNYWATLFGEEEEAVAQLEIMEEEDELLDIPEVYKKV